MLLLSTSISSAQTATPTGDGCTDFTAAPPPRLVVREYARFTPGILLNLRPVPTTDQARLAQISSGTIITVTDGPRTICFPYLFRRFNFACCAIT